VLVAAAGVAALVFARSPVFVVFAALCVLLSLLPLLRR
jgi:hypothetical protein